jgi:hypothetical protein
VSYSSCVVSILACRCLARCILGVKKRSHVGSSAVVPIWRRRRSRTPCSTLRAIRCSVSCGAMRSVSRACTVSSCVHTCMYTVYGPAEVNEICYSSSSLVWCYNLSILVLALS